MAPGGTTRPLNSKGDKGFTMSLRVVGGQQRFKGVQSGTRKTPHGLTLARRKALMLAAPDFSSSHLPTYLVHSVSGTLQHSISPTPFASICTISSLIYLLHLLHLSIESYQLGSLCSIYKGIHPLASHFWYHSTTLLSRSITLRYFFPFRVSLLAVELDRHFPSFPLPAAATTSGSSSFPHTVKLHDSYFPAQRILSRSANRSSLLV